MNIYVKNVIHILKNLKHYLMRQNIQYNLNPRLVRGLDYYTKTAFEVQYTPLGAQSAVAGVVVMMAL